MNSPLPWVGGKRCLLKILLEYFPPNYDRYIEVFGGGGSVLFGKPITSFEVYNDFDSDLVNFFRCVKYRPFAFIEELKRFSFNSREEFLELPSIINGVNYYERFLNEEIEIAQTYFSDTEFEKIRGILIGRATDFDTQRAVAFYKQCQYSYASGRKSFNGQPTKILRTIPSIIMASKRLESVIIENKDFEALVKQYDRPNALIYFDPPYFGTEDCYLACFSKDDHVRLRDIILTMEGFAVISYNDCEFIRELYKDFYIVEVSRLNNIAQRYDPGSQYKEIIISTYDLIACRKNKSIQLTMTEI